MSRYCVCGWMRVGGRFEVCGSVAVWLTPALRRGKRARAANAWRMPHALGGSRRLSAQERGVHALGGAQRLLPAAAADADAAARVGARHGAGALADRDEEPRVELRRVGVVEDDGVREGGAEADADEELPQRVPTARSAACLGVSTRLCKLLGHHCRVEMPPASS